MGVKPIPEGYNTVNAYVAVDDASQAIEFYKRAFGAKERSKMEARRENRPRGARDRGQRDHALRSVPAVPLKTPKEAGGTTASMLIYVEDVDEVVQQAVDAGAKVTMPVENQFWGDRFGRVEDPFGHNWQIATHVEDVAPEEMAKRAEEAMAGMTQ